MKYDQTYTCKKLKVFHIQLLKNSITVKTEMYSTVPHYVYRHQNPLMKEKSKNMKLHLSNNKLRYCMGWNIHDTINDCCQMCVCMCMNSLCSWNCFCCAAETVLMKFLPSQPAWYTGEMLEVQCLVYKADEDFNDYNLVLLHNNTDVPEATTSFVSIVLELSNPSINDSGTYQCISKTKPLNDSRFVQMIGKSSYSEK